jgi:hypothetical protein
VTLLTVGEFRKLAGSSTLEDPALQMLLDAAEQAVVDRYGSHGVSVTETVDGRSTYIFLRRRAESITSVTEIDALGRPTTLASTDWELGGDGLSIRRLLRPWDARATVVSVPVDDTDDRKRVQLELVRLELGYDPGVTSETIGAWSEQRASNATWNVHEERERILQSLVGSIPGPGFA